LAENAVSPSGYFKPFSSTSASSFRSRFVAFLGERPMLGERPSRCDGCRRPKALRSTFRVQVLDRYNWDKMKSADIPLSRPLAWVAFATVCGLLSCGRNSTAKAVPSVDDMRQVEEETHLKFPASARVLMWDAEGRMDSYLRLKVEMAAKDWPAFIAASPFRDQPLAEEARGGSGVG
jgi:hypothetical protein